MNKKENRFDEETQQLLLELKKNPALLELRTLAIYDELYRYYGREWADKIMDSWCNLFDCPKEIIKDMLENKHRIQLNKVYNLPQYRRMMLTMGFAWDETKSFINTHYLGKNSQALYRGNYSSLNFLKSDKWVESLKYNVVVLKDETQIAQVYNLLQNIQVLGKVIG